MWFRRDVVEPDKNDRIIVWCEDCPWAWVEDGPIAVEWDYEAWLDVMDKNDIEFKYWQPAPESPYKAEGGE